MHDLLLRPKQILVALHNLQTRLYLCDKCITFSFLLKSIVYIVSYLSRVYLKLREPIEACFRIVGANSNIRISRRLECFHS